MNINNISPLKFNFFLNKTEKDKSPVVKNYCAQKNSVYNSYPKNYYINNLAFKGKDFSEQLIEKLTSSSQDELFEFLDRELKKRIRAKGYHFQTMEDAVQNAMIEIFMIISEYDLPADKDKVASRINEIYEKIKPAKDDYVSEYGVISLQKQNEETGHELIDLISKEDIMAALSAVSEEERQEKIKKIEKILKRSELSEEEKDLIRQRYTKSGLMTYQQVAECYEKSKLKTRLKIKGAILKLQIQKDTVPKETKQKITDLAKVLDISYEEAQSLSIRYIDILNIPSEIVEERINTILEAFKDEKLTKERYVKAIKASPTLISQDPATVESNVVNLVEKFSDVGLTVKDYLNACLIVPTLFGQSPDTIKSNVTDLVEKYENKGLTVQNYIEACLKTPALFYRSPDTIAEHIDTLRYCFFNTGKNIEDKEFFENISKYSVTLTFSTELILLQNLIIQKMFEISKNQIYAKIREFFVNELENGTEDDEIQTPEDEKACLILKLDSYLLKQVNSQADFIHRDFAMCDKKLRKKFANYMRNNKNKTYAIKVKNIDCKTDCTEILRNYLNDLSMQTTGNKKMFNVICEDDSCATYGGISSKYNLSENALWRAINGAKLKIRITKGELTEKEQKKINDLSLLLKISDKETQHLVVDYPIIMNIPIKTVEDMINRADKALCDFKISGYTPKTIIINVVGLVEKFSDEGLTTDVYFRVCGKQPQLFCLSPDTIEKNVTDLVKKFKNQGLTVKSYLPCCVKKPSLFCQSPVTIEKNVTGVVEKFSNEGLTIESYLPACVKQPSLFSQSPDTIEKNVTDLVKKFKNQGLTVKSYLPCCVKQPQLFCQSPDTIEKNVTDLVKKFKKEGLTTKAYLETCLKQPVLFCMSPETIAQHIDILRFAKYNCGEEIDNKEFFEKILKKHVDLTFSSKLLLIKYLIIPKMFGGSKVPKELKGESGFEQKLIDYLRNNPDEKYTINVRNIKAESDLEDILKRTLCTISRTALNRDDVFSINFTN